MDWTMGPADTWDTMGDWLRGVATTLDREPSAIVVVSAHWESELVSVTSSAQPTLLYDYYGFPEQTYEIRYDVQGSPKLANEIRALLEEAGIATTSDPERGLDHGVFVPLKLMFPSATIPVVQLSLQALLEPKLHLEIGRALMSLREQGILIVGSGMSYHNMAELMSGREEIVDSDQFDQWLHETCCLESGARAERLANWIAAPAARSAHPREEHLLPLMVAAGAAGNGAGERVFSGRVMGSTVAGYRFD
jgi:aromatic ring-opening dioxygenase catalytic subunit (LigB family)